MYITLLRCDWQTDGIGDSCNQTQSVQALEQFANYALEEHGQRGWKAAQKCISSEVVSLHLATMPKCSQRPRITLYIYTLMLHAKAPQSSRHICACPSVSIVLPLLCTHNLNTVSAKVPSITNLLGALGDLRSEGDV